ncbi:MAG: hypothetical protein E7601_04030 [Ruminococcaceae bacterium]|nr:hypothetical protein [Oscillospiraceae bacterium]
MKKAICLTLVILSIASCLTACSFTSNIMNVQKDKAESTPKVEEMMSAMAEKSVSDATSLLHPEAKEKADDAIEQIVSYVNGRSVSSMELININVSSSTSTSGKMRKEQAVYQVAMDDGEIFYLNTVYVTNNDGDGFISFQLVLGIV